MQRYTGIILNMTQKKLSPLIQIGSTWMVTAAHCLYIADKLLSAQSLLVLLGLHDRSKKSEPNRYKKVNFLPHLRLFKEADTCGRNLCP